jgi:hypothetical protein
MGLAGSYMLSNPATAGYGMVSLSLELAANTAAEGLNPSSLTKSFRNSTLSVISNSLPGGFTKDFAMEATKSTLTFYAGD